MNRASQPRRAHVIVVGNEKGGTGKSTVAMHTIAGLLSLGLTVGSIDLDARQATLTRYVENRLRRGDTVAVGHPEHAAVPPTGDQAADEAMFLQVIERMLAGCEAIVIDTPGSDHYLSRLGHSFADTLVTPLNDSFIDLDVLGKVDPETWRIEKPSHYCEMVWETKKVRAQRGERAVVDWVVLRNRLSNTEARNKQDMEKLLTQLSRRVGFRLVAGLSERLIYRELFLQGLTLLDLRQSGVGVDLNMAHVAARQELRRLIEAIGLAKLAKQIIDGRKLLF